MIAAAIDADKKGSLDLSLSRADKADFTLDAFNLGSRKY